MIILSYHTFNNIFVVHNLIIIMINYNITFKCILLYLKLISINFFSTKKYLFSILEKVL